MEACFIKGFEKTANSMGMIKGVIGMGSRLIGRGAKRMVAKAKNLGTKTPKPPGSFAGTGLMAGFAGMEVAGVKNNVGSHMNAVPAATMKPPGFSQRMRV